MSDQTTAKPKTKKARKPRAQKQLLLVEVTEDANTGQPCFAIVELPNIPAEATLTPKLIEDYCRKAVYKDSQKHYGNKSLAVVQVSSRFTIPFVERLALTPPTE